MSELIEAEIRRLAPERLLELYELDATGLGIAAPLYFHGGTGNRFTEIVYKGRIYNAMPVSIEGMEISSAEELPRPTIQFSNVHGFFSGLVLAYQDLIGATVTRRRIFESQLTAEDPVELASDVFVIDQKTREDSVVEFSLISHLDMENIHFPKRRILANYCSAVYRDGVTCPYQTLKAVADINNNELAGTTATLYNADTTYAEGAGVYVEVTDKQRQIYGTDGRFYPIVYKMVFQARRAVPPGVRPPNRAYWIADWCRRDFVGCRLRFDVKDDDGNWLNNPLPTNAYPGATSLPNL